MCSYKLSGRVTLYFTRVVAVVAILVAFCLPTLVEYYHTCFRPLAEPIRRAVIFGFYPCLVAALIALWHMDRLLCNILKEQLFVTENVSHIRMVRWCCLAVSLICLVAAYGFPALLLLSLIMAFLFLVVTVVGQILKAAVAIREENDLTI